MQDPYLLFFSLLRRKFLHFKIIPSLYLILCTTGKVYIVLRTSSTDNSTLDFQPLPRSVRFSISKGPYRFSIFVSGLLLFLERRTSGLSYCHTNLTLHPPSLNKLYFTSSSQSSTPWNVCFHSLNLKEDFIFSSMTSFSHCDILNSKQNKKKNYNETKPYLLFTLVVVPQSRTSVTSTLLYHRISETRLSYLFLSV